MAGYPIGSRCIVTWAPTTEKGKRNVLNLGQVVTVISEPMPSRTRPELMAQMVDPSDVQIPMPLGSRPGWPVDWMSPFDDPDDEQRTETIRVRDYVTKVDPSWAEGVEQ